MISFDIRKDLIAARLNQIIPVAVVSGEPDRRTDEWLTVALEDSFPCSDPISSMRAD
jgi:hypothetical protein